MFHEVFVISRYMIYQEDNDNEMPLYVYRKTIKLFTGIDGLDV